jgi:hypothetical protein
MRTSALVSIAPPAGEIADALARAADILAPARWRGELVSISLSGRLGTESGCGLELLRLVETVAAAHHLRQRVQLAGDAFVVTLSSGNGARW